MDVAIATLLDELCVQILDAERGRRPVTRVHLSPREYEAVAKSKHAELEHGNRLVLLGLEVLNDEALPAGVVATD